MNELEKELLEHFIAELKNEGISKVAAIVRVACHFKIGLGPAKIIVHESLAWSEQKSEHERFQQKLSEEFNTERKPVSSNDEE